MTSSAAPSRDDAAALDLDRAVAELRDRRQDVR